LDLGFSIATTREVAKFCAVAPERLRDMIWTISLPYCAGTLIVAVAIYFAAPWIADHAITNGNGVPRAELVHAVGLAGFALTLQLPIYLYTGGLAGLQRQDLANVVSIGATTLRHGAAVFLLWGFSRSVGTLMASQAVVAAVSGAVAFGVLWWHL